MSVVAWDGEWLAADRQGTSGNLKVQVKKIAWLADDTRVAWVGDLEYGMALVDWYAAGQDPAKWPEFQKDKDNWTRLIVVRPDGTAGEYQQLPVFQPVQEKFMAWGGGRDYAMAAMHLGKNAIEAVEVAQVFDLSCGFGHDAYPVGGGRFSMPTENYQRVQIDQPGAPL